MMREIKVGRFLVAVGRNLAMVGGLGLTVLIVLSPYFLKDQMDAAAHANDVEGERRIVRADLVDFRASEGFGELAEVVSSTFQEMTWKDVRALMEAQGCTELEYSLRIRWQLDDGSVDDMTYMRRPFEEPWHASEFLLILRKGPESAASPVAAWREDVAIGPDGPSPSLTSILKEQMNSRRR